MSNNKTVLLVAEDSSILYPLSLVLKDHSHIGYEIVTKSSVDEALSFAEKNSSIDAIVTEIVFGAKSENKEAYIDDRIVKQLGRRVPVIVMTKFSAETENMLKENQDRVAGIIDTSTTSFFMVDQVIRRSIGDFAGKMWTDIEIVFHRAKLGHLFPIERALTLKLGERYIVKKSKDIISIKLHNPHQLQAALDAVLPALAGLEKVYTGEVKSLKISQENGNISEISGQEAETLLRYLVKRFDETFPQSGENLSWEEETFIEAVKALPGGGILEPTLKRLFRYETPLDKFSRKTYHAYRRLFRAVKDVFSLGSPDSSAIEEDNRRPLLDTSHNRDRTPHH